MGMTTATMMPCEDTNVPNESGSDMDDNDKPASGTPRAVADERRG